MISTFHNKFVFKKGDSPYYPMDTKIIILNNYLSSNPSNVEDYISPLKKNFNILKQYLHSNHQQKSNDAIQLMLGFPTKIFRSERNTILSVFRKNLPKLILKSYLDLIRHIRPELINEDYDLYADFISDITTTFGKFSEKLNIDNLLVILKVFLKISPNNLPIEKFRNRILDVILKLKF